MLAALGGFLFGYDTGVVGVAAPCIKKSLGIGAFGESWVVGSLLLGAILGAFLSGRLADLLSRKWTKFAAGIVYTAAALGSAVAPTIETLCAARFVLGIAVGTASFVAPMYISEFQQILGINTVIYFGATILHFAGLSISTSVAQAVFLGIINFAGAGMAMLLLDRAGRRVPMIAGTAGCVIGLVGLGWFFHQSASFQHANAMIAPAFIMWYLASFEISLGPVFWVMIAEIYPLAAIPAGGAHRRGCIVVRYIFLGNRGIYVWLPVAKVA